MFVHSRRTIALALMIATLSPLVAVPVTLAPTAAPQSIVASDDLYRLAQVAAQERASRGDLRTELTHGTPNEGLVFVAPRSTRPVTSKPSQSKVDVVIAFARRQIGKPYVWGAAGPNAYDCSGLVMRAFAQIGIKLPHYTGTMIRYGRAVPRAAMLPGDIVFPSSGHVGIYIGGGKMIVAPHTGAYVRVQTVYAFYAARRVIK